MKKKIQEWNLCAHTHTPFIHMSLDSGCICDNNDDDDNNNN